MKKYNYLLTFLFVALATTLLAQASIIEEEKNMNLGIKNALVLELPNTDNKLVEKLWKKYVKQFGGKTRKVRRTDEWMTDNANIGSVSMDDIDLYASFEGNGTDAAVNLWVNLGEDDFINSYSHSTQVAEIENILLHFAQEVEREKIKIELAEEEKKLKKLDSDLKRLVKSNEGYHKDIENAKERIKKAEQNIINNEKEQEVTKDLISKQGEVVEAVRQKLKDS